MNASVRPSIADGGFHEAAEMVLVQPCFGAFRAETGASKACGASVTVLSVSEESRQGRLTSKRFNKYVYRLGIFDCCKLWEKAVHVR